MAPDIECSLSDPDYGLILYPAYASVVIYVIGIPFLFGTLLYWNRSSIIHLQRKNVESLTIAAQSFRSPKDASFAAASLEIRESDKFGLLFLYYQYKPQYFFWTLVVLLR